VLKTRLARLGPSVTRALREAQKKPNANGPSKLCAAAKSSFAI
jgi:hypothetical protein